MTLAIPLSAHESTDGELLARFLKASDQSAFEQLVHRHVDWIYAAALRMTRQPSLAEDVTQAVLWSLAKKAHLLSHRPYLGGWLHEATRYAATNLLRSERRRKERERVIAREISAPGESLNWEELQPRLDQAIARLPAPDRDAILLRYLQRKSHEEIGVLLGITPEAARKRVARALERLRQKLGAEGKPEALGAVLVAGPVIHAPSHLAGAILSGNISTQAALLAKGVILMHKALVLKLAFAAAVLTVCTGYLVESYAVAQGTSAPAAPAANAAADPVPAPVDALTAAPANPATPPAIILDGRTFLMTPAPAAPGGGTTGGGSPPQIIIMNGPNGTPGTVITGRGGFVGGGGGGFGGGGGGFFGGGGGGTAGGVSSSFSTNGTTLTRHISNTQYDITLQTTGNATTAQIKDANGKELYSGPLMTDADRAKIPADALPLIDGATRQGVMTIAAPNMYIVARPQLSLEAIKQQLGATDEQWTDLQDRVRLVMTLQRDLTNGSSAPMLGRGRGPAAADITDPDNPITGPAHDLTDALADNSTKPEDLEAKVDAVRSARQQVEDSLAKNRQKLEAAVTPRQKAVLVNLQILE